MFLYRLQEKADDKTSNFTLSIFVICTKNCTDNIKTSKSENYSFSKKKIGEKIDFQFWFFIRTKKTELHYPIIEPL